MRRLVEPQFGICLVSGKQEIVLGRELGESGQEFERRDGSGRIVRIVDPQDGRARPRVLLDRVEVREECVPVEQ